MSKLKRKSLALVAFAVFVGSAFLLITSSPWLVIDLFGLPWLPLGTLIVWAGFVALPAAATLAFSDFLVRKSWRARIARYAMTVVLLLSGTWGLVGYALAGNWNFNFSNRAESFQGSVRAAEIFWDYSISIFSISVVASTALLALALSSKRQSV